MARQENAIIVASFTDPRVTPLDAPREQYIRKQHGALAVLLGKEFNIIDPLTKMREAWNGEGNYGISSETDIAEFIQLASSMQEKDKALVLVLQGAQWTEPFLALSLAKQMNLPIAVYAPNDPEWAGNVCISSLGATLLEQDNHYFRAHFRTRDSGALKKWIRAALAYMNMKQRTLVMWGDSDCLRMKHLQGDVNQVESIFTYRVLQEGQYRLIKRAEEMITSSDKRIDEMISMLEKRATVKYEKGSKLDSRDVLVKQTALYLAARDRLKEIRDSGEKVAGISLKCQPELSEDWGFTGCLVPSFIPFAMGEDMPALPATCEGDMNGTLSASVLHAINPEVPPLFGDFKHMQNGIIYISNCGGSSVYYAANSNNLDDVLPNITLEGQCQGDMGAAVGYMGKKTTLTVLRFFRVNGKYRAQAGLGKGLDLKEAPTSWGAMWPTVAIDLGVDDEKFVRVAASNHFAATEGDYLQEVLEICRLYKIPVERIDSNESLEEAYRQRVFM